MNISLALCTFNRCDLLEKVLERITKIDKPKYSSWNFIIINNNSTDETHQVVNKFLDTLPIKYILEKKQGLSHARNAALNQAIKLQSEYIIWIDDDVFPSMDWFTEYESNFNSRPNAAFFGGSIAAKFEGVPPKWLESNINFLKFAFAITSETGNDKGEVQLPNLPIGANFALKISSLNHYNFNADLGIQGKKRLNGEETALMEQLLKDGKTGFWLPNARVEHFIPRSRQTFAYLGVYYRSVGRTETVQKNETGKYWQKKWALKKTIVNSIVATYFYICYGRGSNDFLVRFIMAQTAYGRFFS